MTNQESFESLSPAKRALYEIRALRGKVDEYERRMNEPIAITGMGLRFPGGAFTPEAFWRLLADGVDAISEIPASRWDVNRYYDPDPDAPGKAYSRHGAFLDDPWLFDAGMFGISPREAATLDPQHRLAIETAWEALERSGWNPAGLNGTAGGVFLALGNSDYGRRTLANVEEIDAYAGAGAVFSAAAGRISYLLGLQGPSMAVDTACSGSLVAVHLACQSLRARECRVALAGGVNLMLSPEIHVNLCKSRMIAPDGRCKTFDSRADGYARGEGCGMVALERLSDALAARDPILAVIRGSALNQDGRSSGLTAPNGSAQEALLRQALANAGVQPGDIDYVEAHGTGTSLGDPIEARALGSALGAGRAADRPLVVGSVKTNIGHLEAAAGVAGLIKTVLALEHETIPSHLHFREINPHIDWSGAPVHIPAEALAWRRGQRPRRAGVSSFGFSGTNAHVIVEEAPAAAGRQRAYERPLHIVTVSGRNDAARSALAGAYAGALGAGSMDPGDFAFTANAGRAAMEERSAYIAADGAGMRAALLAEPFARGSAQGAFEAAFLFPGQGAQYAGMGRELYDASPVFRGALDECAALLRGELEEPLTEVLWGRRTDLLGQTAYTQPALVALEYALAQLWRSWGIEPVCVLGHSVGEYAAACIAELYSLEDGLRLIAARARLMQGVSGQGAMSAALAAEERVRPALAGLDSRIRIAALNAPENTVISGYADAVREAGKRLAERGIVVRQLAVSHAFHSPQMEEMVAEFERVVRTVAFHAPRLELISSVTGRPAGAAELSDPQYWLRQVREPVRFRAAMETLAAKGMRVFLETGPGSTLAGLGRQTLADPDLLWAPSLRQVRGEWQQMLESVAQLYVRGAGVNWAGFDEPYQRRRVALPTYPFQRQRYWVEPQERGARRPAGADAVWEAIRENASRQSAQGPLGLDPAGYARRWEALEDLSAAYIVSAWRSLGVFRAAEERHTAESLVRQGGIRPAYRRMMARWLDELAARGILAREGEGFGMPGAPAAPDTNALAAAALKAFPTDRALAEYAIDCGEKLAAILAGKASALETLFADGSFARAEAIYENASFARYFAGIVRACVEGFLRGRRGAAVSLVEIGAGTGGTTSALLPLLGEDAVYHFTDVSDFFLNYAERKFAAFPRLRFGRLDIERSPAEQGFGEFRFDVVIATNVLHATRDLRETLANARALLAPGGILLLSEATRNLLWMDITVGLTEGWRRWDDDVRRGQPLAPVETWERILPESGFESVMAFPEPGAPAGVFCQHVFVARVPESGPQARSAAGEAAGAGTHSITPAAEEAEYDELRTAPAGERHERMVALIRRQLAAMLRFESPELVERKRRLMDLGLDSLMTVELRNRLARALRLEKPLSATVLFDYPTMDALAESIERDMSGPVPEPAPEPAAPEDPLAGRAGEIGQLEDEEVEALLLKRLQSL